MDKLIQEIFAPTHIIVWTLITFTLTLCILGKWAWPAILGALEARESGIQDDLDQARELKEEAQKLLEEHKRLMAGADDKIRAMVDEAKRDAQVIKSEFEQQAQKESQLMRDRSLREIELAKEAAIGSLREESVNLSVSMASKLLGREVQKQDHDQLIDACLKELDHGA